jgi:hypothetical protein
MGFKVISMERNKRRVNPSRIQKKLGSNWNTSNSQPCMCLVTFNSNIMYGTVTSVGRIFGFFRYLPWISKMTSDGYH